MKCPHDRITSTCSVCKANIVFRQYAYKAKERGLAFDVPEAAFIRIVSKPCALCDEKFSPRGLDRIENGRGYIYSDNPHINNIQSMCGPCNFFKGPRTMRETIEQAAKITKHQESLKRKELERKQSSVAPAELPPITSPPQGTEVAVTQ